jgi:hypothetical protein
MTALTTTPDPLLLLINSYRDAVRYCDSLPELAQDDDAYMALAEKTYFPLQKALINSKEIATTAEGARAALDLAREQYKIGETPLIGRMMEAAAGYLATA